MFVSPNNPAARLYNFLSRGKNPTYRNMKSHDILGALLAVGSRESPLLLRRIGKVLSLPQLIERQIRQTQGTANHSGYLTWLANVADAFGSLNLEAPWSDFIDRVDDASLDALALCAERLSSEQPENIIRQADLQRIRIEVEDMLYEIRSSIIDGDLRRYLLNHVVDMKNAIEDYEIQGIVPIQRAFEATVGSLSIHPGTHEKIRDSKQSKRFWTLLARVALVIGIAGGAIQIGEKTVALLSSPEIKVEESLQEKNNQKMKPESGDFQTKAIQT